ncbi:lysophospholipase [Ganoderma leucocontextum]|nr:lysophospholipase [Ganoderma leucocontextum]
MWSAHFRRFALLLAAATAARTAGTESVASYAPYSVSCPSDNLIRDAYSAHNLHPDEASYVRSRQAVAKDALQGWLKGIGDKVYDGDLSKDMPSIALALSGGNFRAALFNAAALEAFDSRNSSSVSKGLGGLLQSSTYMSALSGGSYVLASLMFNDFASGYDLVFGNNATSGWQLEQSLFAPGPQGQDAKMFITHLIDDLAAKRFGANFTVTFCDLWGRALAYHFLPGTTPDSFASNATAGDHAASLTFSSATNLPLWQKHELPFPLVVINVNSPNVRGTPFGGNGSVSLQTVVYELSPLEFGSYEPQLSSFVPLPYLGSTFAGGNPSHCVNGFDNAGLMIGTSSCDFNPLNITNSPAWTSPQALGGLVDAVNQTFRALQPNQEMDVTSVPNPFYGLRVGTYQDSRERALALFDGSLDDQNDPLFPLLVKGRKVDVIVALDSSGETSDFKPNGQSLLATKTKVEMLPRGFMSFPTPFPNSTEEFVSLGLNTRPVFFGCDAASNADQQFPCVLSWS